MNKSVREDAFFNWVYKKTNIQILLMLVLFFRGDVRYIAALIAVHSAIYANTR